MSNEDVDQHFIITTVIKFDLDEATIASTKKNDNLDGNTSKILASIYLNKDAFFDLQLATKQFLHISKNITDVSVLKKINDYYYDFIAKNLDRIRIVEVNSYPAVGGHLTPKTYVDTKIREDIDASSLFRMDPDGKFDQQ